MSRSCAAVATMARMSSVLPLTVADDGQSGAVNDEVQAGARAGAPKREGEMLTASRERGVIGCREIDAQHPEDRCQEALGLTQRSVEDETERQGGFDGEIGILELPAPPADASRCPRGDRVGREPEGDVASPHEGSVVLGPVPDAILCLVLRMHSRLHIEIMTRRRSRWSTCRPLLAHRAESAHQRRRSGLHRGSRAVTALENGLRQQRQATPRPALFPVFSASTKVQVPLGTPPMLHRRRRRTASIPSSRPMFGAMLKSMPCTPTASRSPSAKHGDHVYLANREQQKYISGSKR